MTVISINLSSALFITKQALIFNNPNLGQWEILNKINFERVHLL